MYMCFSAFFLHRNTIEADSCPRLSHYLSGTQITESAIESVQYAEAEKTQGYNKGLLDS